MKRAWTNKYLTKNHHKMLFNQKGPKFNKKSSKTIVYIYLFHALILIFLVIVLIVLSAPQTIYSVSILFQLDLIRTNGPGNVRTCHAFVNS